MDAKSNYLLQNFIWPLAAARVIASNNKQRLAAPHAKKAFITTYAKNSWNYALHIRRPHAYLLFEDS